MSVEGETKCCRCRNVELKVCSGPSGTERDRAADPAADTDDADEVHLNTAIFKLQQLKMM